MCGILRTRSFRGKLLLKIIEREEFPKRREITLVIRVALLYEVPTNNYLENTEPFPPAGNTVSRCLLKILPKTLEEA